MFDAREPEGHCFLERLAGAMRYAVLDFETSSIDEEEMSCLGRKSGEEEILDLLCCTIDSSSFASGDSRRLTNPTRETCLASAPRRSEVGPEISKVTPSQSGGRIEF